MASPISHNPETQQPATVHQEPQKSSDPQKICITNCKHDGKTTGAARSAGQVMCSFCLHVYHKDCISYPATFTTFWPCPSCKSLAADVKSLHVKLENVITQNASLTEIVAQQQTMITSLLSLEKQVTALTLKLIPESEDSGEEDEVDDAEPQGQLLVGDSLIRDVSPTDAGLTVDSTGGATLTAIRKKLKAINPRRNRYQKLYIVAGTNDCSSKRPAEKIAQDCKSTIAVAKLVATDVTISSIPPRADNRADRSKVDTVNQLISALATEENVTFINHDDNFLFRDNSVDTTLLLADQLHLSHSGVNKLLQNLKLTDKASARNANRSQSQMKPQLQWSVPAPVPNSAPPPLMSVNTSKFIPSASDNNPSPVYFRGTQSPLSNFFEFPLSIWNMNFESSEHAYQYHKCISLSNRTAATDVLRAPTPLEAKKIGDNLRSSEDWEDSKQGVMYEILRSKSRQCPEFLQALNDSQHRTLIEDTPNAYWGRGRDSQGLNMLGRLLMTLRSELAMSRPRNFTPRPTTAPPRNAHGHTQPHDRSQQPRCFNYGEASHTKASCRHGAPLRCYACHGIGHKQKFCSYH